jgi:cellobiose-specific phosphotransferase system component IIA
LYRTLHGRSANWSNNGFGEYLMSGNEFHVHGPHDHEVEHAVQHGADPFTSRLAVLTAILSTIGAIFGYMGGHSQNAALLLKNEAAIQKTSASNQWNYYQAKSNKQNLAELSIVLTKGEAQQKYIQAVDRYKTEKEEIKEKADKLEEAAKEADHESEAEMHVHQRWAMATTLLQVAITLSAITLLTRKRWLLIGVFGATGLGLLAGAMGYLHL